MYTCMSLIYFFIEKFCPSTTYFESDIGELILKCMVKICSKIQISLGIFPTYKELLWTIQWYYTTKRSYGNEMIKQLNVNCSNTKSMTKNKVGIMQNEVREWTWNSQHIYLQHVHYLVTIIIWIYNSKFTWSKICVFSQSICEPWTPVKYFCFYWKAIFSS